MYSSDENSKVEYLRFRAAVRKKINRRTIVGRSWKDFKILIVADFFSFWIDRKRKIFKQLWDIKIGRCWNHFDIFFRYGDKDGRKALESWIKIRLHFVRSSSLMSLIDRAIRKDESKTRFKIPTTISSVKDVDSTTRKRIKQSELWALCVSTLS